MHWGYFSNWISKKNTINYTDWYINSAYYNIFYWNMSPMQSSIHRGCDLWLSVSFDRLCCLQAQCLSQEQGISFQVFDSGSNSAQSSFPALLGSPGFHKLFGEKQRLIYLSPIVGTQTYVEYIYIYIYIYTVYILYIHSIYIYSIY